MVTAKNCFQIIKQITIPRLLMLQLKKQCMVKECKILLIIKIIEFRRCPDRFTDRPTCSVKSLSLIHCPAYVMLTNNTVYTK